MPILYTPFLVDFTKSAGDRFSHMRMYMCTRSTRAKYKVTLLSISRVYTHERKLASCKLTSKISENVDLSRTREYLFRRRPESAKNRLFRFCYQPATKNEGKKGRSRGAPREWPFCTPSFFSRFLRNRLGEFRHVEK